MELKYVPDFSKCAEKEIYEYLQTKERTPEICLAAVQQDGHALQYVKEQTPEICLAAVQEFSDCEIKEVNKVCGEFDTEEDLKKYLDFILLNSTKASILRGLC